MTRVALVIGGGSGIGRAAALALAKQGTAVVVAGRREAPLAAAVAAITEAGGKAAFVTGDVSKAADVDSFITRALESFGGLDVGINAFGLAPKIARPLADTDDADLRAVLDVNYRGLFLATRAEAKVMIPRGGGAIVNVASVLGLVGWAGQAAYAASKHAAVGLSQVMAEELIELGVRLNTVCPGLVRSSMMQRLAPRSLLARGPEASLTPTAEHVAATIVWLASSEARAVVGQAIEVGRNVRRL